MRVNFTNIKLTAVNSALAIYLVAHIFENGIIKLTAVNFIIIGMITTLSHNGETVYKCVAFYFG